MYHQALQVYIIYSMIVNQEVTPWLQQADIHIALCVVWFK